MNYDRFRQLWDALVTQRPKAGNTIPITNGMTDATATALTEYADGKKEKIEAVRKFLSTTTAPSGG